MSQRAELCCLKMLDGLFPASLLLSNLVFRWRWVYPLPGASVMKRRTQGTCAAELAVSHHSGGQRFRIGVSAGSAPSEAVGENLLQASLQASGGPRCPLACGWLLAETSLHLPSVGSFLCPKLSPFYKDTSHIGLGRPVTLFYLVKTLFSNKVPF